jgi:hypothetical protein
MKPSAAFAVLEPHELALEPLLRAATARLGALWCPHPGKHAVREVTRRLRPRRSMAMASRRNSVSSSRKSFGPSVWLGYSSTSR